MKTRYPPTSITTSVSLGLIRRKTQATFICIPDTVRASVKHTYIYILKGVNKLFVIHSHMSI